MAVDECGLVCKYIIIAFDCIFAVVGLALTVLGLWLRFSNGSRGIFEIEDFNSSVFVIWVTAMIVLGVMMLIIVSFGDFGACSEHRCALQVFACLVAMLFGGDIVVTILVYTFPARAAAQVVEFYSSLYIVFKATKDPVMKQALIIFHKLLHCCGVTGMRLEDLSDQTCPVAKEFLENFVMDGCHSKINSVFETPSVFGAFLGIGALLIILFICSLTLTQAIRATATSPQYILLSPTTPCINPQPPLPAFPNSDSAQDPEPVVFTPLTATNIPLEQAWSC